MTTVWPLTFGEAAPSTCPVWRLSSPGVMYLELQQKWYARAVALGRFPLKLVVLFVRPYQVIRGERPHRQPRNRGFEPTPRRLGKQLMLGRGSWPAGWDDPVLAVSAPLLEVAPPLAHGFVHVGRRLLVSLSVEELDLFEPHSERQVTFSRSRATVKGEVYRVLGWGCPRSVDTG
jgi:hypothetical protein